MIKQINLPNRNNKNLILKEDRLKELKSDLNYIYEISNMDNLDFAKRSLFGEEIKANNLVEDYKDDITYIDGVIHDNKNRKNADGDKKQRILNLYNGYKYILEHKDIDKETLKELYAILSRNILSKEDRSNMGDYYRNGDVYIFNSDNVAKEPDKGLDVSKLDDYMNYLFDYINTNNDFDDKVNYYIKSQIMHYYFVSVHPYFDVNGRCSRTLAMWYLLNNKEYPYIIFNRGINYNKATYYKYIKDTRKFGDITIFVKYMMQNVKEELIKEYGILEIEKEKKLNNLERQCINYIMSMNSAMTAFDFATTYNRFNDLVKRCDVMDKLLNPLIEKDIIIPGRKTKKKLASGDENYFFKLNDELLENYNELSKKLKR